MLHDQAPEHQIIICLTTHSFFTTRKKDMSLILSRPTEPLYDRHDRTLSSGSIRSPNQHTSSVGRCGRICSQGCGTGSHEDKESVWLSIAIPSYFLCLHLCDRPHTCPHSDICSRDGTSGKVASFSVDSLYGTGCRRLWGDCA